MHQLGRVLWAAVILAAGVPGACSPANKGVEVHNETGEVVRAELLTVNAAGETSPYSSAIVNRGATFRNAMSDPIRGQAMRIRFTLEDPPAGEGAWNTPVVLTLPEKKIRVYSLRLDHGRLRAEEHTEGLP